MALTKGQGHKVFNISISSSTKIFILEITYSCTQNCTQKARVHGTLFGSFLGIPQEEALSVGTTESKSNGNSEGDHVGTLNYKTLDHTEGGELVTNDGVLLRNKLGSGE